MPSLCLFVARRLGTLRRQVMQSVSLFVARRQGMLSVSLFVARKQGMPSLCLFAAKRLRRKAQCLPVCSIVGKECPVFVYL